MKVGSAKWLQRREIKCCRRWPRSPVPHRLRIVARLHRGGRNYISRLAREVGLSRPLLHLHLRKLEAAGLVTSRFELSPDGKALNVFELADFAFELNAANDSRRRGHPHPTSR